MKPYSDAFGLTKGGLTATETLVKNLQTYGVRDESGNVIIAPQEISLPSTTPQAKSALPVTNTTIATNVGTTNTGLTAAIVTDTFNKYKSFIIIGIAVIVVGGILFYLFKGKK